MKLPKALTNIARQAAATLPDIKGWPSRTEVVKSIMLTSWQYGLRSGLMVGLPSGVILTLIVIVIWGSK